MREMVKNDPEVIKKFEEYNVPMDYIDKISISFCPLDVSAKTKNKKIYLNERMLEDPDPASEHMHYVVHELVHFLQQLTGKNLELGRAEDEYLEKPTEEEAFEAQIKHKENEDGSQEAERYTNQLLDHHGYKGKRRKEKKDELLNGD